jgi:hypothetical protein
VAFQYPKHPRSDLRDPFQDEHGRNPFADEAAAAPLGDDPYAAPVEAAGVSYRPTDFVTIYSHRGPLVLGLSLWGLVPAGLATAAIVAQVLFAAEISSGILTGSLAVLLIGAVLCAAAWLIGRQDLPALRAGAMAPEGLPKTRRGFTLASLGLLLVLAAVVALVWRMVLAIAAALA